MALNALNALSPVDGRYRSRTEALAPFFSEEALIRYRLRVEVEYFIALCEEGVPQLASVDRSKFEPLRDIYRRIDSQGVREIKEIEKETNHDVKAVEYYLKRAFEPLGLGHVSEFIHFGLTSQDINNTAIPLSIKEAMEGEYVPRFRALFAKLKELAEEWAGVPMLARTHGQPASPTRLGKELEVFVERLRQQITGLETIPFAAKFGGATGNFNAHKVAYPDVDWKAFGTRFVQDRLGLHHSFPTTQIEHYDHMAALFDALCRINTIVIDLDRDIWSYIAMDYFKQRLKAGEIGSSAMPHKVNPIDFENAEGNLGMANAIFQHLSSKLPISRLQRDLTDSTVLRNVGVPFAHTLVAFSSTVSGLGKLVLNPVKIEQDLDENWAVVAEAIQTILRREGYPKPYEALKELTRTHKAIDAAHIHAFIDKLGVEDAVKAELKAIRPSNYTGI